MASRTCQHGNCQVEVPGGEGVSVSAAGWRVKFCCWTHAAKWVLAMGSRHSENVEHRAHLLRVLADLDSTAYHWVTVRYNPGVPQHYFVKGAPSRHDAEGTVLRHIGYHPGVPLSTTEMDGHEVVPEYETLEYKPLTPEEKELIRYND